MSKKNMFRAMMIIALVAVFVYNTGSPLSQFIQRIVVTNVIVMVIFSEIVPHLIVNKYNAKGKISSIHYLKIIPISGNYTSSLVRKFLIVLLGSQYEHQDHVIEIPESHKDTKEINNYISQYIRPHHQYLLIPSSYLETIKDIKNEILLSPLDEKSFVSDIIGHPGKYEFILDHNGQQYDFKTDLKERDHILDLAEAILYCVRLKIPYEILYEYTRRLAQFE